MRFGSHGRGVTVDLRGENPPAAVHHEGRPADAGHCAGRALDGQRVQDAGAVVRLRRTASEQPQAPLRIEIARIAGAMPDLLANRDLRFLVAVSIEIP